MTLLLTRLARFKPRNRARFHLTNLIIAALVLGGIALYESWHSCEVVSLTLY
jgi:hypothetical protein